MKQHRIDLLHGNIVTVLTRLAVPIMATALVWYGFLKDFSPEVVNTALNALISTRKSDFAPSIGVLMDRIYEITHERQSTGLEMWPRVLRAIKNSAYHAAEEFEALPEACKKAVGTSDTLRDWALMPLEKLPDAQARFIKSYEITAKRQQEFETMPRSIQELVEKTRLSLVENRIKTNMPRLEAKDGVYE